MANLIEKLLALLAKTKTPIYRRGVDCDRQREVKRLTKKLEAAHKVVEAFEDHPGECDVEWVACAKCDALGEYGEAIK